MIKTLAQKNTSLLVVICGFVVALSAIAAGPDFAKRTILVRVLDVAGKPIPGTSIHRSVWTPVEFPANADYVTDEQGEVNMVVPEAIDILRLWATKKEYVPLFANFDKKAMDGTAIPATITFGLSRGTTVGGFVLNESGAPVAGARVEVCVDSTDSTGRGEVVVSRWLATEANSCVTNERGFWSLDNVPEGTDQRLGLWLTHPEFVSDLQWRGFSNAPFPDIEQFRSQKATVIMDKGVKVRGTITDSDGNTVPNAMVVWGHEPYHNPRHQETFSDKDGVFRLPPLSLAQTILTVVAQGFAPQLNPITPTGSAMVLDFKLLRGRTTQFIFLDSAGKRIPEVKVNIAGWRGEETLFNWRHPNVPYSKIPDQADKNGEWNWDWSPDDAVDYYFHKNGYDYQGKLAFGPGKHQITLQNSHSP